MISTLLSFISQQKLIVFLVRKCAKYVWKREHILTSLSPSSQLWHGWPPKQTPVRERVVLMQKTFTTILSFHLYAFRNGWTSCTKHEPFLSVFVENIIEKTRSILWNSEICWPLEKQEFSYQAQRVLKYRYLSFQNIDLIYHICNEMRIEEKICVWSL